MKVMMVNRPDAESVHGGDSVQLRETAAALRRMGTEVEEALGPQEKARYRGFDLIHFNNLQSPAFLLGETRKAKESGRPVVLSTIYWNVSRPNEQIGLKHYRWRHLARLAGRPLAAALWRARERHRVQMQREVLGLCDLLLPNSCAEADQLHALACRSLPLEVIHLGLDRDRFRWRAGLPFPEWASKARVAPGLYAISVGRVQPWKNTLGLAMVMRRLNIPLVLAGAVCHEAYARACEAAGATLTGPLHGDGLLAAYAHARLHVMASYGETVGLSSIEAAAMGCAVASTKIGGLVEYLGAEAVYFDPEDEQDMADAVQAAWQRGGTPALQEKARSFTWDDTAHATMEAYKRVVTRHGREGAASA